MKKHMKRMKGRKRKGRDGSYKWRKVRKGMKERKRKGKEES